MTLSELKAISAQQAWEDLNKVIDKLRELGHKIDRIYEKGLCVLTVDNKTSYKFKEDKYGCTNAENWLRQNYSLTQKIYSQEEIDEAKRNVAILETKTEEELGRKITNAWGNLIEESRASGEPLKTTVLQNKIEEILMTSYHAESEDIKIQSVKPIPHKAHSGTAPSNQKDYVIEFMWKGIPQKIEFYKPRHQKAIDEWKKSSLKDKKHNVYLQMIESKINAGDYNKAFISSLADETKQELIERGNIKNGTILPYISEPDKKPYDNIIFDPIEPGVDAVPKQGGRPEYGDKGYRGLNDDYDSEYEEEMDDEYDDEMEM